MTAHPLRMVLPQPTPNGLVMTIPYPAPPLISHPGISWGNIFLFALSSSVFLYFYFFIRPAPLRMNLVLPCRPKTFKPALQLGTFLDSLLLPGYVFKDALWNFTFGE